MKTATLWSTTVEKNFMKKKALCQETGITTAQQINVHGLLSFQHATQSKKLEHLNLALLALDKICSLIIIILPTQVSQ